MADTEAAPILPGVSSLKRSKVLRVAGREREYRARHWTHTRRAATRLLQAATPLRHRMVGNKRELLRRYKLPVRNRELRGTPGGAGRHWRTERVSVRGLARRDRR